MGRRFQFKNLIGFVGVFLTGIHEPVRKNPWLVLEVCPVVAMSLFLFSIILAPLRLFSCVYPLSDLGGAMQK